ncbi:tyrosine-type recombinase/integrase [Lacisediminihabitans changchengi]|uniref:Tyrosine-type recombinase/integrase n=1 Tax=Lacisediminihabitans changchengi TaxID=2787634 RepID=A0A934VXS1_9MICO|nr:tyrosine-type recombinase/integrase [Lacisediminihabitans changchengi]MBK4347237.1 tyrosine-type recombinase/integrase [Lacisediminihabitans changchengi]
MGTVTSYATTEGKRYRVLYRKPDHSQTSKRGFRTKRDAELFLASVEISKSRGEFVNASDGRVSVQTLAETWLASQTHLKPSSLEPVEIALRLYVLPRWGSTAIADIRHSDVQTWIAQMGQGTAKTAHAKLPGPRSATVVLRAYGVLASILDVAARDRRLATNPARGVSLPRKGKKARVYLTHERVRLLADNAGDHGTMIRTLAYTGLRWGEVVGLRVRDLDALRRRLNVRENAVRVGGRIEVGTPKTHEARSVPFPLFLSIPLARAAEGKSSLELLFGNGRDYVRTPSHGDGWFAAAVADAMTADADFPRVTPHDLRHTAASLAISAGANVKAVQRMLGHASAAMTLDTYADLFDDDLDAVADALHDAEANSNVAKMLPRRATSGEPTPLHPSIYGEVGR